MPFSEKDRIIIEHYRLKYKWGAKKIFKELGQEEGRQWPVIGIAYLLRKVDKFGSVERRKGSGQPRSARTAENTDEVEEEIFSQEDPESGNVVRHESPRMIAQRLGISKSSNH